MNLKMLACEQLFLLLLLLGVIKFTIAFNPKRNKLKIEIEMLKHDFRRDNDYLKNKIIVLSSDLETERYRNDELERKLNETMNNVKGISSGSQNVPDVETLLKQIDSEKKKNNKQADQIDQQKEQIERLDYQLEEEKAKRSLMEATIESIRIKCDVGNVSIQITGVEDKLDNHITSVTEMLNVFNSSFDLVKRNLVENEKALYELIDLCCSNLSSVVKSQDCEFGDQTCAMTSEDGSGSTERCEGNQGMKQVLLDRTVESKSQVNVKSDDDTDTPFITGSTVMSNGYIVLCDLQNDKLKLLDSSLNITGSLSLSSWPWDVSAIDNTNVIVTLPSKHQLQFIQVIPHMIAGRILHLGKSCYGIAFGKDQMYISCHNGPGEGEVRILSMDGTLLHQLGVNQNGSFMFLSPYYIAVSESCDKVFVSDYFENTITCMSDAGQILYQYKDDDLRRPEKMYCDGGDNIIVCGRLSHNVQVITAEGKKHGVLASSADGISKPYSISFRHSDNSLIIGLRENKHIFIFKLTR